MDDYLQILLSAGLRAVVRYDGVVLPRENGLGAFVRQQRGEHEDLALLLGEYQGFSTRLPQYFCRHIVQHNRHHFRHRTSTAAEHTNIGFNDFQIALLE